MLDKPPAPLLSTLPPDGEHRLMIADLAAGRTVSDRAFDRIFPEPLRKASSRFWTPLVVALRVAKLLVASGAQRVLDVGSGPGKFCLVGAATTEATFHGIEHRPHLVAVAKTLSGTLGLSRAEFREGTLDDIDWTSYDAFYFYNPFEENLFARSRWLDDTVRCTRERFRADIAKVEAGLDKAPAGARVVTFQGLQGRIPVTFRRFPEKTRGIPFLNFWVKMDAGSAGGAGIFDGDPSVLEAAEDKG